MSVHTQTTKIMFVVGLIVIATLGYSISISRYIGQLALERIRRLEKYAKGTRELAQDLISDIETSNYNARTEVNTLITGVNNSVHSLTESVARFDPLGHEQVLSSALSKLADQQVLIENMHQQSVAVHEETIENAKLIARSEQYMRSTYDEMLLQRASLARAVPKERELETLKRNIPSMDEFNDLSVRLDRKLDIAISAVQRAQVFRMSQFAFALEQCNGLFTESELIVLTEDVNKLDPLLAVWIYVSHDAVALLPLREMRRLSSHMRQLGYWNLSNKILREILVVTKSESDEKALDFRTDELDVFNDGFRPSVSLDNSQFVPTDGHILHVVGKVLPKTQSGYTLRTHYSALAQLQAGYKVSVVALIGEAEDATKRVSETIDGVQYFRLLGSSRSKWMLSSWLQANVDNLAELVAEIRPSVLHAHSDFLNALVARIVGSHFGVPVIYESRGFWEESWISRTAQRFEIKDWEITGKHFGLPDAYRLRQQMEISMREEADHVITLANVMKTHITKLGGVSGGITVVPNAVDSAEFPVSSRDNALALTLGIPEDAIVVGYISSIVEYEGIDVLIRAFNEEAHGALADAHLVIVGDGAQLEALKALVESLSTPRVHFTGKVPHDLILGYYSLIDIFVVPRRPVAVCELVTPLKPFEAFSTGRAVIMSDVGALREISEQGECARTFPAGDHRALAGEIVALAKDPQARLELGAKAAAWVRAERSWDRNAKLYAEVYQSLGIAKHQLP
ncbi:glycosyltransferase [Glutamicibacter sp.]|uniref:glycosyltransferase n=1 Tax=Glutamicibacter sp. TaxID=1931995 RepID=UPI002FDFC540